MAARKGQGATQASRSARPQPPRRDHDGIRAQRDRLVAEVATLRAHGVTSRFVENAQQLLTRWWSGADWAGRQQLLKNVEWLIQLAKISPAPEDSAPNRATTGAADAMVNPIEILPVLLCVLAIACLPLLSDGPPTR